MKKIYFSLLFVLAFITQSYSQFFEGFEGSLPDIAIGVWPLGSGNWEISDNGVGTTNSWTANNAIAVPPLVFSGANTAYINRENIGAGNTSEDWLVTPAIAVNSGDFLDFFTRTTILGDSAMTSYQVRISTTSQTDHSTFTPIAGWTESELTATFNIFEQKIISLDAYAGQTVYIAFVMNLTQPTSAIGGDRWIIDNVSVSQAPTGFNSVNGTFSYGDTLAECNLTNNISGLSVGIAPGNMINVTQNGAYWFYTHDTDVTITASDPNSYFTFTPESITFNFDDFGNFETANFCITPNGVHPDLEIALVPLMCATPGELSRYFLYYRNSGTQVQSGTINLTFNDAVMNYASSTPLPLVNQTENNVTFSFSDLQPLENRLLRVSMQLNTPMDTPPLNLDDVIHFTASINSPLIDETLQNNFSQLHQAVVSSFDPNDKIVLEGATITPDEVGNYLHYVIRFQNTGNAPAQRVVVRDVLEDDLDVSTIQILGGSHPFTTAKNGNLIEFKFDDINLPAVSVDESGSNGFVIFKIKPKNTVGLGSVISNNANIYFDYNFPITTNNAVTTVTALGTSNPDLHSFTMYPNPAKNELAIAIDANASIQTILIYNLLGQLVQSIPAQAGNIIDVSGLGSGTYLVEILSDKGKLAKKLVKI